VQRFRWAPTVSSARHREPVERWLDRNRERRHRDKTSSANTRPRAPLWQRGTSRREREQLEMPVKTAQWAVWFVARRRRRRQTCSLGERGFRRGRRESFHGWNPCVASRHPSYKVGRYPCAFRMALAPFRDEFTKRALAPTARHKARSLPEGGAGVRRCPPRRPQRQGRSRSETISRTRISEPANHLAGTTVRSSRTHGRGRDAELPRRRQTQALAPNRQAAGAARQHANRHPLKRLWPRTGRFPPDGPAPHAMIASSPARRGAAAEWIRSSRTGNRR